MINQIAPLPQKTTRLGLGWKDLVRAHDIQARVRQRAHTESKPESGLVLSPATGLAYRVPILRWIE